MRPVRIWCLATAACLTLVGAKSARAQDGLIQGRVLDSAQAPVVGAILTIDQGPAKAQTDVDGRYTLRPVPPGSVTLRIHALGFTALTTTVTVPPGGAAKQDLTLARSAITLAPVNVVTGSHARHTTAEELPVPVDIVTAETIEQQGTTETSQILQQVSPSINFPRNSVTDADDIVRPFTMRGMSPDHTLVLLNGVRYHRTALIHTFAFGMAAGSTGVDLNTLPSSAIGRMEVLRDGASSQYGSDAIAGVVNVVLKEDFAPYLTADYGQYNTADFPTDGRIVNVNAGYGLKLGRGTLGLFGEYRYREPTNRAYADPFDQINPGDADSVNSQNGQVVVKNNPVPMPNYHWGDGSSKDGLGYLNFHVPVNQSGKSEVYAFGGFSNRVGTGTGYRRTGNDSRNWPEIYPLGFLPAFHPTVKDISAAAGLRGQAGTWNYDVGGSFGRNQFRYDIDHSLNVSLGPCLDVACSPAGIPNQTSFYDGTLSGNESSINATASREINLGLPKPVNLAIGASFRYETFKIEAGEPASYIDGGHADRNGDPAPTGSQVFGGFRPDNVVDENRNNAGAFADMETNLTEKLLLGVAGRYEHYSDFGSSLTGKLAARYQLTKPLAIRAAVSNGFRAPSLAQEFYSSGGTTTFQLDTVTGQKEAIDYRILRTNSPIAATLGAKPLRDETSINVSGGFVFAPTAAKFSMTVDGYYIKLQHRIVLSGLLQGPVVETLFVNIGEPTLKGAQYFSNGLETSSSGVDVTADYRIPMGGSNLEFNAGFNYGKNTILHEDPLPHPLSDSGLTLLDSVTRVGIQHERPAWRATLESSLTHGPFRVLGRLSGYGPFSSVNLSLFKYDSYSTRVLFDTELAYRFKVVELAVGARNLFDTYPTKSSLDNSFSTFPWPGGSPFGYNGRFIYTRVNMGFNFLHGGGGGT